MNGKLITLARKEKKLSQEKLAELLNTNQETVSRWESGIQPSTYFLHQLAVLFEKPIEYFIGKGEGKESPHYKFTEQYGGSINHKNSVSLPIYVGVPGNLSSIVAYQIVNRAMYPGAKYIFRCSSDDMEPEIKKGSDCIITPKTTPLNNKIMLVKIPGKGYSIKKVKKIKGTVSIHSVNPKYRALQSNDVKFVGLVTHSIKQHG